MDRTDTALLRTAADRAGRRPGFLAYDLARYVRLTGADPTGLLGVSPEQLSRLALCRTPRRGVHFGQDVLAIAVHLSIIPVALAGMIRQAEALGELQAAISLGIENVGAEQARSARILAAARVHGDEHTVLLDRGTGLGTPGWLHDAVKRFWADAPAIPGYPRDLDFAVLVGLPLAVVELPTLCVSTVTNWLTSHEVQLDLGRDMRPLHACLVALGGVGLIFVDSADDATQRRVNLAHEGAHFVVEYLLPRQEVAHRRPELLDVIDGRRPPTARERMSAIFGDVPVGLHTHLLNRHVHGNRDVDAAEWRARRVALEVLAPQHAVMERMRASAATSVDAVVRLLVDEFGLPVSLAADYAEQLSTVSKQPRLGLLDLLDRGAGHDPPKASPGSTPDRAEPSDRQSDPLPEED
jgi:hypothetical protein